MAEENNSYTRRISIQISSIGMRAYFDFAGIVLSVNLREQFAHDDGLMYGFKKILDNPIMSNNGMGLGRTIE